MVLFSTSALGGVFSLFGASVGSTADEAAIDRGAFVGFFERSETEPEVRISGASAIQVPTGTGSSTVFSQSNADVKLTRTSELVGLKFTGRPKRLRYSVFLAQVRKFEIEFASGSATNRFGASDSGLAYGIGVSGSFVPTSVASVGIGWDLQYRQTLVDFERFVSALGLAKANQRLVEDEIQASATASKRFGQISPYAGLKVSHWITRLEDRSTGERLRGNSDGASVLVGFEWEPIAGEAGFAEASFLDEESFSIGWGFRF